MTIQLLRTDSEPNRLTKTFTHKQTIEAFFKEPTSLTDPIIILERSTISTESFLINANMIYIQDLNRYYFITETVSVANNLWEYHCHVDVLMTYNSQISASTGIIKRSESKYNLYYDDGSFKKDSRGLVKYYKFPQSFNNWKLVLAVAGWGNYPHEE